MASTTRFQLPYLPRSARAERTARRRRRLHAVAAVFVAAALAIPAAGATTRAGDPAADARAKREEIRRQKAELAAQIDLVKASDQEVAAALNAIDVQVKAQEDKVAEAQHAVDEDAQRIADLQAQIQQSQADITKIQDEVQKKAVQAYLNPQGDSGSQLLQSKNIDEAEQRKVLAQTVTGNDHDAIDELRSAKAQLAELQRETDEAKAQAEQHRQAMQDELDDLAASREEQAKVKAEWDKRLAGLQDDANELQQADADLTAQIQQAEAAQRAREEQARQAAIAQAQAQAQPKASGSGSTSSSAGGSSTTAGSGSGGTAPAPSSGGGGGKPSTSGGLIWPIAGTVSQEFGHSGHPGIDIFAPCGTPIWAAKGGTVIVANFNNGGYGNLVVIDHGGGFTTAYAHQSQILVSEGQTVSQGQTIGLEGTTGYSTGCHLHFETRVNGSVQNPRNFLP